MRYTPNPCPGISTPTYAGSLLTSALSTAIAAAGLIAGCLVRDTITGAPNPATSPDALAAASFASPALRASLIDSSIVTRWRIAASTSASGRFDAGLNSTTRPETRVLGATSTASVLRLFFSASAENSACRNLALLYGASPSAGDGMRVRLLTVCTVSLSLSATGFRLSACSYTVSLNTSASSENFFDILALFSSAVISPFTSSRLLVAAGTTLVTVMMW